MKEMKYLIKSKLIGKKKQGGYVVIGETESSDQDKNIVWNFNMRFILILQRLAKFYSYKNRYNKLHS